MEGQFNPCDEKTVKTGRTDSGSPHSVMGAPSSFHTYLLGP